MTEETPEVIDIQPQQLASVQARLASFLLDIGLMIWHAAVDLQQTWIWWASVVILGGIILAMFTLFEKRRQDIRNWLDRLHKWE